MNKTYEDDNTFNSVPRDFYPGKVILWIEVNGILKKAFLARLSVLNDSTIMIICGDNQNELKNLIHEA
jgi:hypothetical protein